MSLPRENWSDVRKVFNREVWIVTASDRESRAGLTATWVLETTLTGDEPVFVVSMGSGHATTELARRTQKVGLHLLRQEQAEFALRFGLSSSRNTDKFAGLAIHPEQTRVPVLTDCLFAACCRIVEHRHAAAREFFWIHAEHIVYVQSGVPLREKDLFATATDEQKSALKQNRDADTLAAAPLLREWLKG